jgi:hypothetical protein
VRYLRDISKKSGNGGEELTYRMKSWTWLWIRTRNLSRSPPLPDEGDRQPSPPESDKKTAILSPQSPGCSQTFRVSSHPSRTVHSRRPSPRQGWRPGQASGTFSSFLAPFPPINHPSREPPTKAHFARPVVSALSNVLGITRT